MRKLLTLIVDCHNNLGDTPFYISLIVVIHTAKMCITNSISLSYLHYFTGNFLLIFGMVSYVQASSIHLYQENVFSSYLILHTTLKTCTTTL